MTTPAHDPGGKSAFKIQRGVYGQADISECGRYRTTLWRLWTPAEEPMPEYALWIGCNPSTASADLDDPTVRREVIYTRSMLGLGAYCKVNVMNYRATYPKDIGKAGPASSDENLPKILELAKGASRIIAAWGRVPKKHEHHATAVRDALLADGHELWCLAFNKDGSPKHPLYIRGDAVLVRYPKEA